MGSLISRIAISVLRFFHLAPLPEIEQSESSSPSALPPAMQTKSVVRRKYVAEEVTVTNTENHPLIEKATDEFESDCFNRSSSCQDPCGTSLLKTDEAPTFREITSTNQVENTENPQESSVNQSESCTKEIHAVRKVTWKGEADRVEVTGSWVDWDKLIPLQLVDPEENIWQSDIPLSSSNDDHSVEMKFVVDSEWLTSADMATVTNGVGTMNNVIYLDREE